MPTPEFPLFEPTEVTPAPEGDVDDFAQRIAANARPVEYVDRTSDAARDQGWGPVEVHGSQASTTSTSKPRKVVETPTRGHDNNPLSGITPADGRAGMSQTEIEAQDRANAAGFAAAKAALKLPRGE